ncbi:MAG: hypothetical protein NTZ16_13170, partial [Verrucomicrobia bacterium]|nr:hypothetical protein [Verrucomicrobiota bacterium]
MNNRCHMIESLDRKQASIADFQPDSPRCLRQVVAFVLVSALVQFCLGTAMAGTTQSWVGNTSANWNNGANWNNATNPAAGDSVSFGVAGTSGTTLNNDLTADINLANTTAINFANNAPAYTLTGNRITLGGNVSVGTGITAESVYFNILLSGTRTVTVNSGILTLGGVVSGSTYGITKAGAGTLTLA